MDRRVFTRGFTSLLPTLLAALAISGCGGSGPSPSPPPAVDTGFSQALANVGKGFAPSGTGFGWIDLTEVRDPAVVGGALGPGLGVLFERPADLRSVGVEISNATAATSIATSYGLALRIDGAETRELQRLLDAAGASKERSGEWTNYDLGNEWEAQLKGPLAPLGDLVPRIAVGPDSVIVARIASAREALEEVDGDGSPLVDPANALAARCLGPATSARTFPGDFTHKPSASPDLIAVGVLPGSAKREVLCVIGADPAKVSAWEKALGKSFLAAATDPLSGQPISASVAGASIDQMKGEGVGAARAELALAPGESRGYLYRALAGGEILPFIGASRPVPEGSRVKLGG